MSMKLGEATIASRIQDAQEEVMRAGAVYDKAKKALREFNDAAAGLVHDANIERRRQSLRHECLQAFLALGDANVALNWMKAEARKHKRDDGSPRIKD
jgi:hypothetical protein